MRDIILALLVFGALPFVLIRPAWGVLLWAWLALASPHRLTYGFAYDLPWVMIVAVVTIVAVSISREPKRLPLAAPVTALLLFVGWTTVTSAFSSFPTDAWDAWQGILKTFVFVVITLLVMQTPERIKALVWIVVLGIGFYGVKGGLYTLAQGGGGMVVGPPESAIEGNTEIALALTMTLPLMYWLKLNSENRWVRRALVAGMVLSAVAVLGTYSRGGLLALAAMAAFLLLQVRRRFVFALVLALLIPALLAMMPGVWFERMQTIETFRQDESAQGRLNAWNFAKDLAAEHPMVGGGFRSFRPEMYDRYAIRRPSDYFDAHSIWFEVLAEHGYFGLGLYLFMWLLCWRTVRNINRLVKDHKHLGWAADLGRLTLASLVGFWVGGSFLGLAYWDYSFLLMALLVLALTVASRETRQAPAGFRLRSSVGVEPPQANTTHWQA